jgi:hypothetical protein
MSYIGAKPAEQILSSADIQDGSISTADLANGSITAAKMASAGAWGPAGTVLQVVNATYGTQAEFTSTTYADTGLSASITPKFSTSKILVLVNQTGCAKDSGNTRLGLQLLRGASVILANIEKGAAYGNGTGGNFIGSISSSYLDSPATTSSTTYKTQGNSFSAPGNGSSRTQQDNTVSTITLMEIAG